MADTTKAPKSLKEIGDSGTVILAGQIFNPDYNTDLVGDRGIDAYDQMRLGDATVKAALRACKLPILSAKMRINPASDSAEDAAIAEFVETELRGMNRTFEDTLREALTYLDYGRYLFEIVYRLNPDGRIGLQKLSPRLPKTVYAWETTNGQPGIQQLLPNGSKVDIPIERLVIFVNDKEGDNWEGFSLLRSAYKHWKMKDALEKIDAMAHERQGLGIPFAKSSSTPQKTDKDEMIERIKALRANENDGIYIPMGWEVGFMDMMSRTTRNPLESIQYHGQQILLSVLAAFLGLGTTETGSRAVSQDLSEFFEMSVKFVAAQTAATFDKYVIERLVDLNFNVEAYPTMDFDGIGSFDFGAVTESLLRMSQFGTYTPQLDVENSLRKAMGLPEAPEDSFYPDPSEEPEPVVVDEGADPKNKEDDKQMSQTEFLHHFAQREAEAIRLALSEDHAT